MQLALQDFGVEVKSVPVGLDVLPVTKTFKPDILFADVLLSKRNGYEVCADIKADPETRHIPVVLMWSGFMEIDDAKMNQAKPNARLEKPFDAESLRQLVMDLVAKTQSNPVSAFLQFPKMPEFADTPSPAAPVAAPVEKTPAAKAKPTGKIPESAPVNFDNFDPTADTNDSFYRIPDVGTHSGLTRSSPHDLPLLESEDVNPEEAGMVVAADEEFATVPLKSSQQKDQHEDDGWQRQDLKKFKIEIPEISAESAMDEDFAKKFVIPQEEDLDKAHIEVEGEFEEVHFGEDLTASRLGPAPRAAQKPDLERIQTKPSPKATTAPSSTSGLSRDAEMIERVIQQEAREVIESICWKVIPEIAERIVREEIHKILRDVEKSI